MKHWINHISFIGLWCALILATPTHAQKQPELLLAETYRDDIDLSHYWLSEKYDGVRAYWDGTQLLSRQGNIFHAPRWFTQDLPKQALDGELWIGRDQFSETISTVSKDQAIDHQWRRIRYMVFELPGATGNFSQRIEQIKQIVDQAQLAHLIAVPQSRIENEPKLLQQKLDEVLALGGEGLMLHRADALYHGGRSRDLLKVKTYEDGEAIVLAHLPGKGKYTGMLGALLVETPDGIQFRIGTGLTDKERAEPPAIDSQITYKYFGKTNKGTPRFASYLRVYRAP